MKITKTRLKEIISEELSRFNNRRTVVKNEASDNKTFEMVDAILNAMEPQEAFENLVQAMEKSLVQELLLFIIQQYEIPFDGNDEVEEYNPSDF